MFLFNNIHDRNYHREYPNIPRVIFDISDAQLRNIMNSTPWNEIEAGDICCVVTGMHRMSTFYRVEERRTTTTPDSQGVLQYVITGKVVGIRDEEITMTALLNRYNVEHRYLRNNQFTIGFNVANLGDALGELVVRIRDNKSATIAELENNAVV